MSDQYAPDDQSVTARLARLERRIAELDALIASLLHQPPEDEDDGPTQG